MIRNGVPWREIREGETFGEVDFIQHTVSGDCVARAQRTSTVFELPSIAILRYFAKDILIETKFLLCLCQYMALQIRSNLEDQYPGRWCAANTRLNPLHHQELHGEHHGDSSHEWPLPNQLNLAPM